MSSNSKKRGVRFDKEELNDNILEHREATRKKQKASLKKATRPRKAPDAIDEITPMEREALEQMLENEVKEAEEAAANVEGPASEIDAPVAEPEPEPEQEHEDASSQAEPTSELAMDVPEKEEGEQPEEGELPEDVVEMDTSAPAAVIEHDTSKRAILRMSTKPEFDITFGLCSNQLYFERINIEKDIRFYKMKFKDDNGDPMIGVKLTFVERDCCIMGPLGIVRHPMMYPYGNLARYCEFESKYNATEPEKAKFSMKLSPLAWDQKVSVNGLYPPQSVFHRWIEVLQNHFINYVISRDDVLKFSKNKCREKLDSILDMKHTVQVNMLKAQAQQGRELTKEDKDVISGKIKPEATPEEWHRILLDAYGKVLRYKSDEDMPDGAVDDRLGYVVFKAPVFVRLSEYERKCLEEKKEIRYKPGNRWEELLMRRPVEEKAKVYPLKYNDIPMVVLGGKKYGPIPREKRVLRDGDVAAPAFGFKIYNTSPKDDYMFGFSLIPRRLVLFKRGTEQRDLAEAIMEDLPDEIEGAIPYDENEVRPAFDVRHMLPDGTPLAIQGVNAPLMLTESVSGDHPDDMY